jgi:hypothetical protein
MRPAGFLNAVGALSILPTLAPALSVSHVMRQSLDAYAKRDLASEILTDIEHLTTCAGCEVR